MVTCMECGRSFCRLCNPPPKTGQYCPTCHEKVIARFSEQPISKKKVKTSKTAKKSERKIKGKATAVTGIIKEKGNAFGTKSKEISLNTVHLPGKTVTRIKNYLKGRFPVTLVDKEELETLIPFKEIWYKFAIIYGCGVVLWALIAILARERSPFISLAVSILVAGALVWVLGAKNDIRVGVLAVMIVLLTLMTGELVVQVIVKLGLISKIDVINMSMYILRKSGIFYRSYYFTLIVWRMLPGAVVAFLIGLWPLPKRLSWKGFEQQVKKEGPIEGG